MRCTYFMAVLGVIAASWSQWSRGAELVTQGKSAAVILVPEKPTVHEESAARELKETLARMSEATLATESIHPEQLGERLKSVQQSDKVAVVLGRLASPQIQDELKQQQAPELQRGAFALRVTKDAVYIAGPEEGTYYGVIELLEQLGCRWFMPGDLGEVIPSKATVHIRDQWTIQRPSFTSRWFQMPDRDWQARLRCGGDSFPGAHGMPTPKVSINKQSGLIEPAEYRDWFALSKGKRTTRQHCLSNSALLDYVVDQLRQQRRKGRGPVIGLGPNDGGGFCECENCRELDAGDFDPFSNETSVTDRYVWFFNQVLKRLDDEFPDTKLAFYVYHSYMRPPVKHKPDSRITGALAPIALDRVHGFSNPIAPEKSYARWLYQEWGKLIPELYDRGYWSNLACPGFPFIIVHRLRDEIPKCHEFGLKGWRVETFPNYGPQFPSMYIAGKLMWDHTADVDALLQDCSEKFFGPAAEPMGQYLKLMDAALRDSDHITGSAWDMPHHYPAELRLRARKLLQDGQARAGDGIYARRVKVIAQTFDMLESFIAMQEARVRVDFVAAQAELKKLDDTANELMNLKPVPMVSSGRFSTYTSYMKRFFRPCTEQGFARVTNGNQVLAKAQDEWDFQIDPAKVGEDIGWWRADLTGGSWQKLKTSSQSWSNQGLRYYKGLAWYRQKVQVPANAKLDRVFLWCGGADELVKVWVNGKFVGISHGAAFYPFEVDATEAVKPGENVIVMCVSNQVVNELGTGGLVAPVMLYAPAVGKDAKLENVRDLKPTFP